EDMGLTKEQVDSILDENSQDIGKVKGDLDTANQEITSLREQIVDRDSQLEILKNSTGDVQEVLDVIDDVIVDNILANNDEPDDEGIKLQKIYDEIFNENL
ncbi:MAG: phage scaffolding protein, partial [Lachnospiraceae bacterium]|nr:phage scaffolding protein [Lachnospiraceae bacterium]